MPISYKKKQKKRRTRKVRFFIGHQEINNTDNTRLIKNSFTFQRSLASRHAETAFLCESFQYFLFLLTLISILTYLLTLTPFVNLTVDTFPVTGDSLRSLFFLLYESFSIRTSWQNKNTPAVILERQTESE